MKYITWRRWAAAWIIIDLAATLHLLNEFLGWPIAIHDIPVKVVWAVILGICLGWFVIVVTE